LEDDSKVLNLVDLLLRTPPLGLRKIARALGCSRDTVRAARSALMEQGKLRPYKERLVELYEDFAEATIGEMVRVAELGQYPINRIAFDHGIILDKRALALGEPTAISVAGHAKLGGQEWSVQALNSWVSAEKESGQSAQKGSIIEAQESVVPGSDMDGDSSTPPSPPSAQAAPVAGPDRPLEGGGGGLGGGRD
jgi:hypothetical protein